MQESYLGMFGSVKDATTTAKRRESVATSFRMSSVFPADGESCCDGVDENLCGVARSTAEFCTMMVNRHSSTVDARDVADQRARVKYLAQAQSSGSLVSLLKVDAMELRGGGTTASLPSAAAEAKHFCRVAKPTKVRKTLLVSEYPSGLLKGSRRADDTQDDEEFLKLESPMLDVRLKSSGLRHVSQSVVENVEDDGVALRAAEERKMRNNAKVGVDRKQINNRTSVSGARCVGDMDHATPRWNASVSVNASPPQSAKKKKNLQNRQPQDGLFSPEHEHQPRSGGPPVPTPGGGSSGHAQTVVRVSLKNKDMNHQPPRSGHNHVDPSVPSQPPYGLGYESGRELGLTDGLDLSQAGDWELYATTQLCLMNFPLSSGAAAAAATSGCTKNGGKRHQSSSSTSTRSFAAPQASLQAVEAAATANGGARKVSTFASINDLCTVAVASLETTKNKLGGGSGGDVKTDPVRNGTLLCQLIFFILKRFSSSSGSTSSFTAALQKWSASLPTTFHSKPATLDQVRDNFNTALVLLRFLSREQTGLQPQVDADGVTNSGAGAQDPYNNTSLSFNDTFDSSFGNTAGVNQSGGVGGGGTNNGQSAAGSSSAQRVHGTIPIPPSLMHLSADAIMSLKSVKEFWGLIALLIHNYIALRPTQSGVGSSISFSPKSVPTTCMFGSVALHSVCAPATATTAIGSAKLNAIPPLYHRSLPVQLPQLSLMSSKRSADVTLDIYTQTQWRSLEAAVCLFIYEQDQVPNIATSTSNNAEDLAADLIRCDGQLSHLLGALKAPYVPHSSSTRVAPPSIKFRPQTVACPSILPHLANGTLLCDLAYNVLQIVLQRETNSVRRQEQVFYSPVRHVKAQDLTELRTKVHRNPRTAQQCMANIILAQTSLSKLPPSLFCHQQLNDPLSILHGDRCVILLLVEDLMRLQFGVPPRGSATSSVVKTGASGQPKATLRFAVGNNGAQHDMNDLPWFDQQYLYQGGADPKVTNSVPFIPTDIAHELQLPTGAEMFNPPHLQAQQIKNQFDRSNGNNHQDARQDSDQPSADQHPISSELVVQHAVRGFVRKERQLFSTAHDVGGSTAADRGSIERQRGVHFDPATNNGNLGEEMAGLAGEDHQGASVPNRRVASSIAVRREGSVGQSVTVVPNTTTDESAVETTNNAVVVSSPFFASSAKPAPVQVKPRLNTVTNAVSSGRSVVPLDEIRDDLYDPTEEEEEDPTILPKHLEYLAKAVLPLDNREIDLLVAWLHDKLGPSFQYHGIDFAFSMKDFPTMTDPCHIFSDGIILHELVSVLTYRKSEVVKVQTKPKTPASKKNNIRKVLNYLLEEKKLQKDASFIEEALVQGNVLAVIYLLRHLREAFKKHRSVHKH